MTLINTDGMAIFGPGSEWFWTALQFSSSNQWEYLYYQHRDGSIPDEYWAGAEAYYRSLVATKPGYARFWSESHIGFDEPFHGYVVPEFAGQAPAAVAES